MQAQRLENGGPKDQKIPIRGLRRIKSFGNSSGNRDSTHGTASLSKSQSLHPSSHSKKGPQLRLVQDSVHSTSLNNAATYPSEEIPKSRTGLCQNLGPYATAQSTAQSRLETKFLIQHTQAQNLGSSAPPADSGGIFSPDSPTLPLSAHSLRYKEHSQTAPATYKAKSQVTAAQETKATKLFSVENQASHPIASGAQHPANRSSIGQRNRKSYVLDGNLLIPQFPCEDVLKGHRKIRKIFVFSRKLREKVLRHFSRQTNRPTSQPRRKGRCLSKPKGLEGHYDYPVSRDDFELVAIQHHPKAFRPRPSRAGNRTKDILDSDLSHSTLDEFPEDSKYQGNDCSGTANNLPLPSHPIQVIVTDEPDLLRAEDFPLRKTGKVYKADDNGLLSSQDLGVGVAWRTLYEKEHRKGCRLLRRMNLVVLNLKQEHQKNEEQSAKRSEVLSEQLIKLQATISRQQKYVDYYQRALELELNKIAELEDRLEKQSQPGENIPTSEARSSGITTNASRVSVLLSMPGDSSNLSNHWLANEDVLEERATEYLLSDVLALKTRDLLLPELEESPTFLDSPITENSVSCFKTAEITTAVVPSEPEATNCCWKTLSPATEQPVNLSVFQEVESDENLAGSNSALIRYGNPPVATKLAEDRVRFSSQLIPKPPVPDTGIDDLRMDSLEWNSVPDLKLPYVEDYERLVTYF